MDESIPARMPFASRFFASERSTTHYLEAGPHNGPLIIFVHGWPEIALVWRAQMEALAADGWRCVAPDLRGFGDSSVPKTTNAYALQEIVEDLLDLHTHLGGAPALWVGHDWGSPIVGLVASHQPNICRGIVLLSVPYLPGGWALPNLIPLVDRALYPVERYPDGQWDYWRFYQNNFEQAVADMDADKESTLASIFRKGSPTSVRKVSHSAKVTAQGGRYGDKHRAPAMEPDVSLWPPADFATLVAAFKKTGFRPCNSYYMNDEANMAFAKGAQSDGELSIPTLFINDEYEPFSNINRSRVGDPMCAACKNLTVVDLPAGHWVSLECKGELVEALRSWMSKQCLTDHLRDFVAKNPLL